MARSNGRAGAATAGIAFGVAAGIALGTYVLAPNLPGGAAAENQTLIDERDEARFAAEVAEAQQQSADTFIEEVIPAAITDTLSDRQVLIMRTADSADKDYDALKKMLKIAGAGDSGTITLEEKFFAQDGADELKSIITNTLPAGVQLSVDKLDAGTHAGESMGSALALDPETAEDQANSEDRAIMLQALSGAGYVSYETGTILPAQVIILLTGNDGSEEQQFAAQQQVEFARALDSRGGNVVVAGSINAASDTGTIGILRANANARQEVTTVDSVNRSWAQAAVVLGAREQLSGGAGAYGTAANAEAVAPALPSE